MVSTCHVNDNAFGPTVQGCRDNFDFTLLFEQSILSIGPSVLLLLLAPLRLSHLVKCEVKALPHPMRIIKVVRCSFLTCLSA